MLTPKRRGGKKMNIEHPIITEINRYGYPKDMVRQEEHFGIDFYGSEILLEDDYVEDKNSGELILRENLERYLAEELDFEFKTAK